MAQHKDDAELRILRRLYDDLDENLDRLCEENGRIKEKLRQALSELSVYYSKFGKLSLQEEINIVLNKKPAMTVTFPNANKKNKYN